MLFELFVLFACDCFGCFVGVFSDAGLLCDERGEAIRGETV